MSFSGHVNSISIQMYSGGYGSTRDAFIRHCVPINDTHLRALHLDMLEYFQWHMSTYTVMTQEEIHLDAIAKHEQEIIRLQNEIAKNHQPD